MRHIGMSFIRDGGKVFSGVFDCADSGELAEAVAEGIRAFQKASPALAKTAKLGALSIELSEAAGRDPMF